MPLLGALPTVRKLTINTSPITTRMIGTIISEKLIPELEYISFRVDSSQAALNLLENMGFHDPRKEIGCKITITRGVNNHEKDAFNALKVALSKYDPGKRRFKIEYGK